MTEEKKETNFELAFARLEAILERMNSGNVSLDESLKLYEEADGLILACTSQLNQAEAKIEKLIKNRNGGLSLDTQNRPLTEAFQ